MNNNELIKWNNNLACGIKIIDTQHMGLVEMVNEMFNHVSGDEQTEREYFNKVIREAVRYVRTHFATEERIMRLTRFKGYAEHKKEHDKFITTVIKNIYEYESGGGSRMKLSSFTKFLKDWILSHIALVDKQYFKHLHDIAGRKPSEDLNICLKCS